MVLDSVALWNQNTKEVGWHFCDSLVLSSLLQDGCQGPNITSSHHSISMRKAKRGQKDLLTHTSPSPSLLLLIITFYRDPWQSFTSSNWLNWVTGNGEESSYNWTRSIIFIPQDCKKKYGVLLGKREEGKSSDHGSQQFFYIISKPLFCPHLIAHCSLLGPACSGQLVSSLSDPLPHSGLGMSSLGLFPCNVFLAYVLPITILLHNKKQS